MSLTQPFSIRCIKAAIALIGGREKTAAALGCSVAALSVAISNGKLPPKRCIELERLTNGRFTALELSGEYDDA